MCHYTSWERITTPGRTGSPTTAEGIELCHSRNRKLGKGDLDSCRGGGDVLSEVQPATGF